MRREIGHLEEAAADVDCTEECDDSTHGGCEREAKRPRSAARRLRPVRWSAKLDGCGLSWMETQILTHFKLHAVDLREIP
jgi:hypothetical protein